MDNNYKEIIRQKLTSRRYEHSLAVAAEAERLAALWGANTGKAYTAGLLHDVMKDAPREEMLRMFTEFGIIPDTVMWHEFKLWHAVAGSLYARHILRVDDEDTLAAIRWHTTACAGLSALGCVLYLADFTSDDREFPGVAGLRAALPGGLTHAMRVALAFSVRSLLDEERPIHPDTIEAYNEYFLTSKEEG